MKKKVIILILSSIFWLIIIDYYLIQNSNDPPYFEEQNNDMKYLEEAKGKDISNKTSINSTSLSSIRVEPEDKLNIIRLPVPEDENTIPILVLACNRVTISRCLDLLIRYRPSRTKFPIIVSQDCGHKETSDIIRRYAHEVYHVQQPDLSDIYIPRPHWISYFMLQGYSKIARHYKWALNLIFEVLNYNQTIIIEDDLDVAPDFFEYFAATLPILRSDESLWCVSAWNDNGKLALVNSSANDLLYRTDFFPGLGWMLKRDLWKEIAAKWPQKFWDDWMREPSQRKDRCCIRPELPRTRTFGQFGVSKGVYWNEHLKYIYLNEKFAEFSKANLSHLFKHTYDHQYLNMVYSTPVVSLEEIISGNLSVEAPLSVRILYDSGATLKELLKSFNLMDDFRNKVPRQAYQGVVTFMHNNYRVFLTPSFKFNGYDMYE